MTCRNDFRFGKRTHAMAAPTGWSPSEGRRGFTVWRLRRRVTLRRGRRLGPRS